MTTSFIIKGQNNEGNKNNESESFHLIDNNLKRKQQPQQVK